MPKLIQLGERATWDELPFSLPKRMTGRDGYPKPGIKVRNMTSGEYRTVIPPVTDKTLTIRNPDGKKQTLYAGDDFINPRADWEFE